MQFSKARSVSSWKFCLIMLVYSVENLLLLHYKYLKATIYDNLFIKYFSLISWTIFDFTNINRKL